MDDYATYNVAELDWTRLAMPFAIKRVKVFKKQQGETFGIEDIDEDKDDDAEEGLRDEVRDG